MESQPQNPEFRNNPENFYSCNVICITNWFQFANFCVGDILHTGKCHAPFSIKFSNT